ncbi:MAG: hypothetical protein Q8940_21530 [Bacteroidota bacterium]|nr:hypothetical protein [Bacteroidota bacterium]
MRFRYRDYSIIDGPLPETGNILDLENEQFNQLLSSGDIYLKDYEYHLFTDLTVVYPDELRFPYNLDDEVAFKNFLSKMYICEYDANSKRLDLLRRESIFDYLPKLKDSVKSIPLLSEDITKDGHIDKRLPSELSYIKDNYLGRLNCGCGYTSDDFSCYELECYSDYAWIENKICYLYFGGNMCGISFLDLFPFSLR